MSDLFALNELAKMSLTREEYADFLTLCETINSRSKIIHNTTATKEHTETKKYTHNIDIDLSCKIFRNNHIGETVELLDYIQKKYLIKTNMSEDPKTKITNIISELEKIIQQL